MTEADVAPGSSKGGPGTVQDEGAPTETLAERLDDGLEDALDATDFTPPLTPGEGGAVKKVPLGLKVFGVLSIVVGAVTVPLLVRMAISLVGAWHGGELEGLSVTTFIIVLVDLIMVSVLICLFVAMGILLLRNKGRLVARLSLATIAIDLGALVALVMSSGITMSTLVLVGVAIYLVVLSSYLDPALSEERRVQRALHDMDLRDEAEAGTLGYDPSGEGFIRLNFFNLFWIFVIGCVLGLIGETIYHAVVFGGYQDRAGLLYGPFSPIYGLGSVLVTVSLNRFYKANPLIIFVVSAVVGGAFEYFVSWFLQFSFGISAWDYSYMRFNIGGRTSLSFMVAWGLVGLVGIKLVLPLVLRLINLIPWNWRYTLTAVCAVLLAADCLLTLVSYDCWYERLAGSDRTDITAVEAFCDAHYDNAYMQERFQSMSIDPSAATRVEG